MASITIRNLDDDVKLRLRTRAAGNGRSMEEEVRLILREAVDREPEPENLANFVRECFAPHPAGDPAIASWVAERPTSSLFLTAVTEAELRSVLRSCQRANAGTV